MNKLNLSILEAANALGCGRSTIYKLIGSGQLPRVKLGSRALIPVDAVKQYSASLREAA